MITLISPYSGKHIVSREQIKKFDNFKSDDTNNTCCTVIYFTDDYMKIDLINTHSTVEQIQQMIDDEIFNEQFEEKLK